MNPPSRASHWFRSNGTHAVAIIVSTLTVGFASAQEPAPVYQEESRVKLFADVLLRQEWTRDLFGGPPDQSRRRSQIRPRLEARLGGLTVGVGGDFNFSSDKNTEPPTGGTTLTLIRDNYDSREARVDLAFARLDVARWLRVEGGRFEMPVRLTEMIWDRDLRPQGGALTLQSRDQAGVTRFNLTLLGARGSHVFDDDGTEMFLVSLGTSVSSGGKAKLDLLGSFVVWDKIEKLEAKIRRQNSRVAGALTRDYRVLDVIGRLRHEGTVPTQLVVDYCWNTAAESENRGVWLALVLGSTKSARGQLEYTYARVDKDATLAAYGTDDFFWVTGWEGHRGDVGLRGAEDGSFHTIAELIRFKDSPNPEERDHWIKRFRVEVRIRR